MYLVFKKYFRFLLGFIPDEEIIIKGCIKNTSRELYLHLSEVSLISRFLSIILEGQLIYCMLNYSVIDINE